MDISLKTHSIIPQHLLVNFIVIFVKRIIFASPVDPLKIIRLSHQ